MTGNKHGDDKGKKTGPGQPDKDRRVTQATVKIGRNASSGQFTSVQKAKQQPKTHVVETIKKPVPAKQTKKR
jgi:hypothetical protein